MIYQLELRQGPEGKRPGEWHVWWAKETDLANVLEDALNRPQGYDAARITIEPGEVTND